VDKDNDESLVERCRNGDATALEALVVRYQRPIYNAAFRVLGNTEDASDVTQPHRPAIAKDIPGPCGTRGTMMPVGDVGRRHTGERSLEDRDLVRIVHDPELVRDPVDRGEIRGGGLRRPLLDDAVQILSIPVGEENGSRLCRERLRVPRPVVLLVGACVLVALDATAEVVGDRRRADDSGLCVRPHVEAVEVERRPGILHQPTFRAHGVEVRPSARVDALVVRIDRRIQVDLGLHDVQECVRVSGGEFPGLVGVENVVGKAGNA
jgi:hypothetical protein